MKLKNVTEIREQIHLINDLYGLKMTEQDIPFDDQKTWDLIGRGDTLGIFQMASNVAIPIIKKVRPQNIEELSAINAFIRPGASGLDEYIAGKKDINKVRKLDPRLDRHLANSYGAIIYQEDIMFLISELLGISFGQADLYRRALEKPNKGKNVQVVAEFNEKCVTVGVERGFKKEICELVRKLIIDNSGYGFNKSHSIAYAIISYWTAWIKANYPLIFYTAMFNGNLDELPAFMEEAKKNGITINPPHVCYSKYESTIEDNKNNVIRIGLNAVKGVGPAAVESIIGCQPFVSIDEFFDQNNLRSVNKKVVEAIIKAGAFNGLGIDIDEEDFFMSTKDKFDIRDNKVFLNRSQFWLWYEKVNEVSKAKPIPNYAVPTSMIKGKYLEANLADPESTDGAYMLAVEKDGTVIIPENKLADFELELEKVKDFRTKKRPKAFLKLADSDDKKLPPFRKAIWISQSELVDLAVEDSKEIYLREMEEFGYSFISHPLERYATKIKLLKDLEDGDMITIAGIISDVITRKTKTNRTFYNVLVQAPREKVSITLWDKAFKKNEKILFKGNSIKVTGTKGYGGMSCDTLIEFNK